MKPCNQTQRVMAFHDGELTIEEARAMQLHVAGCPACQAELTALQTLSTTVRELPRPVLSGLQFTELLQGMKQNKERAEWHLAWRLTMAAALIVVVSLLGLNTSTTTAADSAPAWELTMAWADAGRQSDAVEYQTANWIVAGLSAPPAAENQP